MPSATVESPAGAEALDKPSRPSREPFSFSKASICGLFLLAAFYTLFLAKGFFLPIVLALLLNALFSPAVAGLRHAKVPRPLGALIVLALATGVLGFGVWQLLTPASEWFERAPQILRKLEYQTRELRQSVGQISEATREAEKIAQVTDEQTYEVQLKRPGMSDVVMSQTWEVFLGGIVLIVLLYFLLAAGDLFLLKLVRVLPRLEDKMRAVQVARDVETTVSVYLGTVTLINAGLGVVVGLAMWLLEVPNPALWGALAAVINFIPYLGAIVMASILTIVSAGSFSEVGRIFLTPAVFLTLTTLEGYFVTPMILGRRLALNHVAIFLSIIFWGWLWGVAGALLAAPLLAVAHIVCERIPPLNPVAEFLTD